MKITSKILSNLNEKAEIDWNNYLTPEQVKTALWAIKRNTRWSCVYEPANKKITYYIRENFKNPVIIEF